MISYGSLVVYVTPKGRRYIRRLEPDSDFNSTNGSLPAAEVAGCEFGAVAHTNLGVPVRIERATLTDILMGVKRNTQIIYPKEIAWICLKLGAGPGRRIIEAGCGSGALTVALSWFCGKDGKVISHDCREEFTKLAARNLNWAGVGNNVELHVRDIADGFAANGADALFLDVREPWLYLNQILAAVKPGASIGFMLPTVPQISKLLAGLEQKSFGSVEVSEILIRNWKPLADRLRPNDRMVAHTGFLVFCRQQEQSREFDYYLPPGTRERKQQAALAERLTDLSGNQPENQAD